MPGASTRDMCARATALSGFERYLESSGPRVEDVQTWLGPLGVVAHSVYGRLEHPAPLRLLSLPVARIREPRTSKVTSRRLMATQSSFEL